MSLENPDRWQDEVNTIAQDAISLAQEQGETFPGGICFVAISFPDVDKFMLPELVKNKYSCATLVVWDKPEADTEADTEAETEITVIFDHKDKPHRADVVTLRRDSKKAAPFVGEFYGNDRTSGDVYGKEMWNEINLGSESASGLSFDDGSSSEPDPVDTDVRSVLNTPPLGTDPDHLHFTPKDQAYLEASERKRVFFMESPLNGTSAVSLSVNPQTDGFNRWLRRIVLVPSEALLGVHRHCLEFARDQTTNKSILRFGYRE